MNEPLIAAKGIVKNFRIGASEIQVLKGIDVEFHSGEISAIVGPSGVGKTTLLNILGALDNPTSGDIFLDGKNYQKMSESELSAFRNRSIGFVFQFHHLLPEFTALENVMMPALIGGVPRNRAEASAGNLLDNLGLEHRLEHKPSELSGGEQQRVAVARSLINQPKLVLADEPSGNLDQANGQRLTEILWELARDRGYGFIIVTHNRDLAEKSDRIIEMRDGRIV